MYLRVLQLGRTQIENDGVTHRAEQEYQIARASNPSIKRTAHGKLVAARASQLFFAASSSFTFPITTNASAT
jgi:hypothetical protein